MRLYESLDRLVGAGLLACGAALGLDTSSAASGGVSGLMRERGEATPFGMLLDALAQEVWLAQDARGIAHAASEACALALADILPEVPPTTEELHTALAAVQRGTPADTAAASIVAGILGRAAAAGAVERAHLRVDVSAFLLERLFTYLILDPGLLGRLRPVLASIERHAAGRDVVAAAGGAPPPLPYYDEAPLIPTAPHSLSQGAIGRLQSLMAAQGLAPEQQRLRLDEVAAWIEATIVQLSRPTNEESEVRRLKACAAAALTEGQFELAVEHLNALRRHLRDLRRRSEERLAEEFQNLSLQMAEEAAATARLGELALARGDHEGAAQLFQEAIEGAPRADRAGILTYRLRHAEVLLRRGDERRDGVALETAARAFYDAAGLALDLNDPHRFALAKCREGHALIRLAEIGRSAEPLEAAVTMLEQTLAVQGLSKRSRQWAAVQRCLGLALVRLGERGDRHRYWLAAVDPLLAALEVFEAEQALDAEQVREVLRVLHDFLGQPLSVADGRPRRAATS